MDTTNKEENVLVIIATSGLHYSRKEARKLFQDSLSPDNLQILMSHICIPELAEGVCGFFEDNGDLVLWLGDEEFIKVVPKKQNVA